MSDEQCGNQIAFRRRWPGRDPDFVCLEHGADTARIAEAMGMSTTGLLEFVASISAGASIEKLEELATLLTENVCACTVGRVQTITITRAPV